MRSRLIDCITGILLCAKTKLARAQLASYFADVTSHVGVKRYIKKILQQKIGKSSFKF